MDTGTPLTYSTDIQITPPKKGNEMQEPKTDKGFDGWVPACGGTEEWTLYANGQEYLYVWNPQLKQHGWLCRSDIVHPDPPDFRHSSEFPRYEPENES
jgi:hypothetical protein